MCGSIRFSQKGSALIVSLAFLVVMTILGISTMGTSRTQLSMANNKQTADYAFSVALSGIENILVDENYLSLGIDLPSTCVNSGKNPNVKEFYSNKRPEGPYQKPSSDDNYMEKAVTCVLHKGVIAAQSGDSTNFCEHHREIVSTGLAAGTGKSVQVQGYYITGPGCQSSNKGGLGVSL